MPDIDRYYCDKGYILYPHRHEESIMQESISLIRKEKFGTDKGKDKDKYPGPKKGLPPYRWNNYRIEPGAFIKMPDMDGRSPITLDDF